MLPTGSGGMTRGGGWPCFQILSTRLIDLSLSSWSLWHCSIEGSSWDLGSQVTFPNNNSNSKICSSLSVCVMKLKTGLVQPQGLDVIYWDPRGTTK